MESESVNRKALSHQFYAFTFDVRCAAPMSVSALSSFCPFKHVERVDAPPHLFRVYAQPITHLANLIC